MLVTLVASLYVLFVACSVRRAMTRVLLPPPRRRLLKSLFLGSFLCFVVINMNLFLQTSDRQRPQPVVPVLDQLPDPDGDSHRTSSNPSGYAAAAAAAAANWTNASRPLPANPYAPIQKALPAPLSGSRLVGGYPERLPNDSQRAYSPIGSDNLSRIEDFIRDANHRQQILNLDKYDLLTSDNAIVIVVQVHNRIDYLRYLIDSLAKAKDIYQTLLIFSHDWFDDEMNQLVRSIDFCPVMQIFYPVMMQLHPHEFPGESPNDCPRDMKKEEALKVGCINAHSPDRYGHYREAKYTQTKHHWFWKLNHVFDYLDVTKNFHGPVLLIEEDHFMVEDFVPVLRLMYRLKEQTCKDCNIFTLGTYDKRPQYYASSSKGLFERLFGTNQEKPPLLDKVDVMNWISSKHNMGMSLNRQVWEQIKKCSKAFCEFDDYNWDWSLQHVSMQCMSSKIRCMVMKSPRIFHIGECGVHHKGKNCDPGTKVRQIQNLLTVNRDKLFPDGLTVAGYPRMPNRMPKPNGGWGDFRDRELCASFATPNGHR